jgi:hypothetical protein
VNERLSPADTNAVPPYNEKESQIVERIKRGELRFDPDLLWLVLHFLNNRLAQIDLPLQLLYRHAENLTELQKSKLGTIKKHASEIQAFLTELREISEAKP